MSTADDQVFERELERIGARRSLLFGLGGLLAFKLTSGMGPPTEWHEVTIAVPLDAEDARATASRILKSMGKLITPSNGAASDSLWAHIGAGYIDNNPTIVKVEFIGTSRKSSQVVIRGAAKEAILVKPRSAYKAVEKIRARLLGEEVPDFS